MKPSRVLFYLLVICASISCQSDSQNSKTNSIAVIELPELLDRSKDIQMGKEWDFVQNFYSDTKKAITKNPKDFESVLKLSELYIKEARVTGEHGHYYPSALKLLDYVLKNAQEESDFQFRAQVTKAGVELSLHEFNTALATAQSALVNKVHNAQLYGVLTDCYVELGEYDKAIQMADKMIKIKPDIRSYSRISYLREIHGDLDGAIEALTLAIKAGYPGNEETSWAMLTLGDLYAQYNENDKAENVYKQILDLRQNYPFAISGLGALAFDKGELKKAEELQLKAMNIIPEVGFYVELVKIYQKQGRIEDVENLMEDIFLMLEDDVAAGHNMNLEYADIYLEIYNKPDQALEFAQLEYAKRPKNIDVNLIMAKINIQKNELKKAEKFLIQAKSTNSKKPELIEITKMI